MYIFKFQLGLFLINHYSAHHTQLNPKLDLFHHFPHESVLQYLLLLFCCSTHPYKVVHLPHSQCITQKALLSTALNLATDCLRSRELRVS